MLISRDPNERPVLTPAMARHAAETRQNVINVLCDRPGAKVGDAGAVTFLAVTPFVPRAGEQIRLEDGHVCQVESVSYTVARVAGEEGNADLITLVPNVIAVLVGRVT